MSKNYKKLERIWLRSDQDYSERWVQQLIADDPSILGLGDLVLRDQERPQPKAGRLDLLLQDADTNRRYEVELQLGSTDESHIIRTIEYWDIERKRYPQYDHCAVIVAEDITSRFLNIISLFNGSVPLIALQMQAIRVGEHVSLLFTKVVDEMARGLVDEDEDAAAAPTDRAYWESKATKRTVKLADEALQIVKKHAPQAELKYNKFYIGITQDGQPSNFVVFRPKKKHITIDFKLPESSDIDEVLENSDVDTLPYDPRYNNYRLNFSEADLKQHEQLIDKLIEQAHTRWAS